MQVTSRVLVEQEDGDPQPRSTHLSQRGNPAPCGGAVWCRACAGHGRSWKGILEGCDVCVHWAPGAGSKSTQCGGCWLEKGQCASIPISPDPGEATRCIVLRGE